LIIHIEKVCTFITGANPIQLLQATQACKLHGFKALGNELDGEIT
jgi:hypothetical protein